MNDSVIFTFGSNEYGRYYNDKVIVVNGVVIRLGSTVFLCEKITTLWLKYM